MKASKELQSKIIAIIREDMAQEAAAGFPLLKSVPDSTTLGVPEYFASMDKTAQADLLDALAHYSIVPLSYELGNEQKAHPVLGKFLTKQPKYIEGDWFGKRPKKSVIKKLVVDCLTSAGFSYNNDNKWREFGYTGFVGATKVNVRIDLDPGLMGQLVYGITDWMNADLVNYLEPFSQRRMPVIVIALLSYDGLWQCSSSCMGWDMITKDNVEESIALLPVIWTRLAGLAERINALLQDSEKQI